MFRLLLLLTLVLAVAGCDTSGPLDEALVGTWTLTATSDTDLLTVSEAQTITDYNRPPTSGALTVSGVVSGTLRHVGAFQRSGSGAYVRLQSDPQGQEGPGTVSVVLQSGGEGGLFAGNRYLPLTSFEGASPFTLGTGVLEVPRATFMTSGEQSVATGRLTFATRALPANRETAVGSERVTLPEEGYVARYTFESDGRLLVTETAGPNRRETRGRWDLAGESMLRIILVEGNTRVTYVLGYAVSGNTMTFTDYIEELCPPDCQEAIASAYGVRVESLLRYRVGRSYRFARSATLQPEGRPAAHPAARPTGAPAVRLHPLARPEEASR